MTTCLRSWVQSWCRKKLKSYKLIANAIGLQCRSVIHLCLVLDVNDEEGTVQFTL